MKLTDEQKKEEQKTRWIGEVSKNIDAIDYKGYFEVDDEVGQIFKQIKDEVNSLEELTEITQED